MDDKGARPLANYVFIVLIALALAGAIDFTWRMTTYVTSAGPG